MVDKSKNIKKLPGLTNHFCLLQVSEKVNSLEVNEQKDVAHNPETPYHVFATESSPQRCQRLVDTESRP